MSSGSSSSSPFSCPWVKTSHLWPTTLSAAIVTDMSRVHLPHSSFPSTLWVPFLLLLHCLHSWALTPLACPVKLEMIVPKAQQPPYSPPDSLVASPKINSYFQAVKTINNPNPNDFQSDWPRVPLVHSIYLLNQTIFQNCLIPLKGNMLFLVYIEGLLTAQRLRYSCYSLTNSWMVPPNVNFFFLM